MSARAILILALAVASVPSAVFAQCDPLVVRYDGSSWWWGAFGACKGPGRPTNRDAIFDCAWSQIPAGERLECLRTRLRQSEQTRQAIDDVAAANGPSGSCDQLIRRYEGSNWWWGAFGRCKQAGGTTDRTAIFECAWAQVPAADRTSCLKARLLATEFTRQGIDTVAAFNGPRGSCDELMVKYDGSRFWSRAFDSCKGAGASADRDAILDCAWIQVPAADAMPCLKDRLRGTEQTRRAIDGVAAVNGAIASNMSTVPFTSCADTSSGCPEACDLPTDGKVPAGYVLPVTALEALELPVHSAEGRLNPELRAIARLADPLDCTLPLSAIRNGLGETVLGQALADLSVTGRRSFARFRKSPPKNTYCRRLPKRKLAAGCPVPATRPDEKELVAGCEKALDRAFEVANFLRTGQAIQANPNKADERAALGWIAVSGEDDAPHRPVNVPSSDFPQYDIDVAVEAPDAQPPAIVTVSTRFVIAQSQPPALPAVGPAGRRLRPERAPVLGPNSDVLVFIHGMDSRAEEAADITRALFRRVPRGGRNLVVISVDLPTSGYAQTLDYDKVSPLSAIGSPKFTPLPIPLPIPLFLYGAVVPVFIGNGLPPPPPIIPPGTPIPDFAATGRAPLLDFIETFVVRFVETLDRRMPFKGNVRAVMGGSLGGNMSFRLGRRADVPWLPAAIVWSPASIWDSLGEGSDIFKHIGPREAWRKANDRDPLDPDDLGSRRLGRRADFFASWDEDIVPLLVPMAQSDTWASDRWPCKQSSIAAARLDRQETYDPRFLSWHWRLGAEQLLYSHQSGDPVHRVPRRYLANYKPMLLACGTEDEVPFNNICSATQKTAPFMTMTPGKALFLQMTGHSIHNERPEYFAQQIDEFLRLR